MPDLNGLITYIGLFMPLIATVIGCAALLWLSHRILIARHPEIGNERMFSRQLIMLGLTIACLVALVLAFPISESSRNQLIGLIGLLLSGIFAFSSSTLFANLMAGIMLRITRPFRTGDFVSVNGHFGRVAERGLLDTEIQTEDQELIAFPNTYLITNPVSVVRSSGTIVSVKLSLGYDIHHSQIETLLLDAVKACGLEDPFVQILELGNFAVTYKASGKLLDTKTLLTARSNLCRAVLDTLHGNGIEIMSPSFMNQRPIGDSTSMIPHVSGHAPEEELAVAEEMVFDKAASAEQLEKEKQQLLASIKEYEARLADASDDDKKQVKERIKEYREQLKQLDSQTEASDAESPAAIVATDSLVQNPA